jgi:hypothetical protein
VPLALLTLALSAVAAPQARPAKSDAIYDVVVVAGIGARRIEGQSALAVKRQGAGVWTVQMLRSNNTWDEATEHVSYDSDAPRPGAPWPLITQHAVAAVAVDVVFDRSGRPDRLVEPDAWRQQATAALETLDLPNAGVRSGEALVDVDGLLLDLGRTFVGTPSSDWTRTDRLTGVVVERHETCDLSKVAGITTWTCRGDAAAVTDDDGQLQDAETWTTVRVDRQGLLDIEEGWSGTLVHLTRNGQTVTDSPIGGRRLVRRR